MRRARGLMACIMGGVLLWGGAARAEPGAEPPRKLLLGITTPIGKKAAIFSATRLNKYLSRQLEVEVSTKPFDDPAALGNALSAGAIDAAWLTPLGFVQASDRAAVTPLVRLSRAGRAAYYSVLFARADTKVDSVAAAKGLRMAWVAEGSASGNLYPKAYLRRAGVEPAAHFADQSELPDHKAVCDAVLKGVAEIGATMSDEHPQGTPDIVDGCREAGMDPALFKVLARYGPIPGDVIAVRADLPKAQEMKLLDAFLSMGRSDEGRASLKEIFHADGFAGATAEDFLPVRQLFLGAQ